MLKPLPMLLFSALLLASCGSSDKPSPLPSVAPKRLSPDLCVTPPAEPKRPVGATIIRPTDDQNRNATDAFLGWTKDVLEWGRSLSKRADKTASSEACRS